jgi:glucosamine-6-phosphate deaminase
VVPGPRKAEAVKRTLGGAVSTECPATILRTHPAAVLYLDDDSSRLADTAIAGR